MLKFTSRLFQYENGQLEEDEVAALFQELINTGTIAHLQGHYQEMAQHLIDQNICTPLA